MIVSLASLVDNRIAKSAANAAVKEYNNLRNEPQKSSDSQNNLKTFTDLKAENSVSTRTEMDTEFGENIDEVKDIIHETRENLMDQEKYDEHEVRTLSSEKSEDSIDVGDVPTSSRSGVETGKSDEREDSDRETTQVFNKITVRFIYYEHFRTKMCL